MEIPGGRGLVLQAPAARAPGRRGAISIGPRQLARQLEIKRLAFEQIVKIQRGRRGRLLIRSGFLQFIDWGFGHMDARFISQREHFRRWRDNQYMQTAFSSTVTSSIDGWNSGRILIRLVTPRERFNSSIVLNFRIFFAPHPSTSLEMDEGGPAAARKDLRSSTQNGKRNKEMSRLTGKVAVVTGASKGIGA